MRFQRIHIHPTLLRVLWCVVLGSVAVLCRQFPTDLIDCVFERHVLLVCVNTQCVGNILMNNIATKV